MDYCEHIFTKWSFFHEDDYKIRQCTLCGDLDIEPIEPEDLGFEPVEETYPDPCPGFDICPTCDGDGYVGFVDIEMVCPRCNGAGLVKTKE